MSQSGSINLKLKFDAARATRRAWLAWFRNCLLIIAACSINSGCSSVRTQGDAAGRTYWTFDNDAFVTGNDDDNYTFGLTIGWTGARAEEWALPTAIAWLRELIDVPVNHLLERDGLSVASGFEFNMTGFTPEDLRSGDIQDSERPFASIVQFRQSNVRLSPEMDLAHFSLLSLGMLGTSIVEEAQYCVHTCRWLPTSGADNPGWKNQISEGGEWTALYHFGTEWLNGAWGGSSGSKRAWRGDLSTILSAQIGYHLMASYGVEVRYGPSIREPFFVHNAMPNRSSVEVVKPGIESMRLGTALKAYDPIDRHFYASIVASYVLYNAMLQGQFHDNVYELDDDEIERFILQSSFGYKHQYSSGDTLDIRWRWRSPEHKLDRAGEHSWLGITYSWYY